MKKPIVSSEWLYKNLNDPNLILLDVSQQTNVLGSSSELAQLQIPGARSVDLEGEFSLQSTSLPNMLPTPEQFEKASRKLGINNSSKIVIYDNLGVFTSPRVWWMFKTMGHEAVSVLDGGLPNWVARGYETEPKNESSYNPGNFTASFDKDAVKSFEFIEDNIHKQKHLVIDARSSGRFNGTAPEPRKGILSGNIPGSINIPFQKVLENGKFKSKESLAKIFDDAKVDGRPIIFSCGSGVTACILLLASEIIGQKNSSIYDGSWTEWAEKTQNN